MLLKIYEYKNCSTCQKALKFLYKNKIKFERIAIVDQPPTVRELKKMVAYVKASGGTLKNLFNISGQLYRELGVSEKLKAGMTEDEALRLLAIHGKLIKRPFVLSDQAGVVGFNAVAWKVAFVP